MTMKYALLIIVTLSLLLMASCTSHDELAKCLTANKVKFYGAWWCPHCADQKELFGNSMRYVNYVECSTPDGKDTTEICKEADIKSYPTWVFADGSRKTGEIPLETLAASAGCTA